MPAMGQTALAAFSWQCAYYKAVHPRNPFNPPEFDYNHKFTVDLTSIAEYICSTFADTNSSTPLPWKHVFPHLPLLRTYWLTYGFRTVPTVAVTNDERRDIAWNWLERRIQAFSANNQKERAKWDTALMMCFSAMARMYTGPTTLSQTQQQQQQQQRQQQQHQPQQQQQRQASVQKAPKICATCGKEGEKLPKCERCRSVRYCGRSCQAQHWPTHKLVCKQQQKKATT